jgi:uncharacterized delta-60 repeat protein
MSYGGGPDFGFGTQGKAPYVLPATTDTFSAAGSAVQPDGKVVVVGYLDVNTGSPFGEGTTYFAAARYNADGTLDTSFGTAGYFTSPMLSAGYTGTLQPLPVTANAVAFQADGKIVIVGDDGGQAVAVRLDADGALDTTFGAGGIASLGNEPAGSPQLNYANSVAILPGGQILVGGVVVPAFQVFNLAVDELNADGSLASTFGVGGQADVPAPAGTNWNAGGTEPYDYISAGVAVQSDGKIDVVGNVELNFNPSMTEIVASRLTSAGTLDSAYAFGGQLILNPLSLVSTGVADYARRVAILADNSLVIGGSGTYRESPSYTQTQLLAVKLTPTGMPDATFGVGGADIITAYSSTASEVGALAIQPDGKIVLADQSFPNYTRLDANGFPDPSFGEGGTVITPEPEGPPVFGSVGLSVLADGNLIAAQENPEGLRTVGLLGLLGHGAVNDFGNTGVSDPAVLITDQSIFAAQFPGGNTGAGEVVQFGIPGAPSTLPAPGAYDGQGIDELAVYLPQLGAFAIRPYSGGKDEIIPFGTPGYGGTPTSMYNSLPAPGDYDGSGKTELGVYLPAIDAIAYRPANGGPDVYFRFQNNGTGPTLPAPGDYYGTGRDDFAIYQNFTRNYEIANPVTGQVTVYTFPSTISPEAVPVPGDYDGSGLIEPAVFDPVSGNITYRSLASQSFVTIHIVPAESGAFPAPGDYDGSGKTEAAAYLFTSGTLTYQPAAGGLAVSVQFGSPDASFPFALADDTLISPIVTPGLAAASAPTPAAVEIPLTPDVLETLAGTAPKKNANPSA